ncbi:MAG: hypothetical protein WCS17_14105 [Prevotella sp.]
MISISVTEKANIMKTAENVATAASGSERSKAFDMFDELATVIGSDEDTTIDIFDIETANNFVSGARPFETVYSDTEKGILVTAFMTVSQGKEIHTADVYIAGGVTALTVKANSLDEIKNVLLVNGVDIDSMRKER